MSDNSNISCVLLLVFLVLIHSVLLLCDFFPTESHLFLRFYLQCLLWGLDSQGIPVFSEPLGEISTKNQLKFSAWDFDSFCHSREQYSVGKQNLILKGAFFPSCPGISVSWNLMRFMCQSISLKVLPSGPSSMRALPPVQSWRLSVKVSRSKSALVPPTSQGTL